MNQGLEPSPAAPPPPLGAVPPTLAVETLGLSRRFGELTAVDAIHLRVERGTFYGFLGPNGAGKSTTIKMLTGLLAPSAGAMRILGEDLAQPERALAVKRRVGVVPENLSLFENLTGREYLTFIGRMYLLPRDTIRERTEELLVMMGLEGEEKKLALEYSHGMRKKLALAAALLPNPELLFLDEPSTGLDPQVRLEIHKLIEELKDAKRTILLTTHYIEEAERLCDRVAIIDAGRIIALGSPREIQQQTLDKSVIEIECEQPLPEAVPEFLAGVKHSFSETRTGLTVHSAQPARAIVDLVKWIDQNSLPLSDIHLKRPTLEDVFIELTGKKLRE